MKRLLFFLTLTLASLATYATGQEGDVIFIDGVQWILLDKPVYSDSALSHALEAALPEGRGVNTANWAGYTAYWSIRQEKLFLDSIRYEVYDASPKKFRTERLPSDILLRVFNKYAEGECIVAKWLIRDIRAAKGKMLYYVHSEYHRNYENERIISIAQGEVCDTKEYQNYVVDGFSIDNCSAKELREKFPLHIERYPELADVKRVVFKIEKASVDAQGNLVECKVRVMKPGSNERLAAEMERAMKACRPWRVMFINSEYRSYGIEDYYIPYVLKE